jgi:hypothetical protein
MSEFKFSLDALSPGAVREVFTIKAPPGMTFDQAKAIFDKQASTGSLTGLKVGDALSSATQAAQGLSSAAASLSQAASGIGGTAAGALQGALKNIPGGIAGAASGIANRLTGSLGAPGILQAASALPSSIAGAVNSGISVAKQTLSGIQGAAVGALAPTAPIGIPDFAKQVPALGAISNLSVSEVTASLASASRSIGQVTNQISNSVGVGKFGFDGSQLEAAGVLKPGTVSQFLSSGTNTLSSVLKSPTVFTGKAGIASIKDLLGSLPKQETIQQELMSNGLTGLKALGVPTDKLNAGALAGTALNAAKSITNTMDWAQGKALPTDVKTALNDTARNANFAVDFSGSKVDDAMKQLAPGEPAFDTVNRATLNAAASRVTGNPKIPSVDYNNSPKVDIIKFGEAVNAETRKYPGFLTLGTQINKAANDNNIPSIIEKLEQLIGDLNASDGALLSLLREAKLIKTQLGITPPQLAEIERTRANLAKAIAIFEKAVQGYRDILAQLST